LNGKDRHATTVTKLFAKTTIRFLLYEQKTCRNLDGALPTYNQLIMFTCITNDGQSDMYH